MPGDCQRLDWDSELFGFRVARVSSTAPRENQLRAALRWCEEREVRCLYFLCDADAVASACFACRSGFDPVDVRITLARPAGGERVAPDPRSTARHRTATEDDRPPLLELAGRSFVGTRFYVDGRFPRDKVSALYQRWVERDLRTAGHTVILAETGRHLAGFASGRLGTDGEGWVGLVAVHEASRGQGVGPGLMDALLHWFDERGAPRVLVATQGRNAAALRLYESRGFRTLTVQLWFHRWFESRMTGRMSNFLG